MATLDLTVEHDGPLAIVTFDELQLKLALLTKLAHCIYQLESDDSVKGIVLTGRRNVFLGGDGFCGCCPWSVAATTVARTTRVTSARIGS